MVAAGVEPRGLRKDLPAADLPAVAAVLANVLVDQDIEPSEVARQASFRFPDCRSAGLRRFHRAEF